MVSAGFVTSEMQACVDRGSLSKVIELQSGGSVWL